MPEASLKFQVRPHHVPPMILSGLAVMSLAYGGALIIAALLTFLDFVDGREFHSRNGLQYFFWGLFVAFSCFTLSRWCTVQFLAFLAQPSKPVLRSFNGSVWPGVSILVPAYQEAENIESTLRSLVELDYPQYEVIVVDDGSLDATFAKARNFCGKWGSVRVTVLRKDNGGKSSALNLAFKHAKYDFILYADADSHLSRDALRLLVPYMSDPRISAVCGQVTVRNRVNIITKVQALDYLLSNGGLRTAQSQLGSVLLVPGPIGLYRRSSLEQVAKLAGKVAGYGKQENVAGPASNETFAEDFQLSLTVLALNGRIVYEPKAVAYTRAPQNILSLINQRYRWMRGGMQIINIYNKKLRALCDAPNRNKLDAILNCTYTFDIYISPLINFATVCACLFMVGSEYFVASDMLAWFLAIYLLNVMTATVCILSQGDEFDLLTKVVLLVPYQILLINSIWVAAAFDHLRKSQMRW